MNGQGSKDNGNARWLMGFFIGLLSGGLIGAAAMLLLAPRAGKRTRSEIQRQGVKLRDQATEGIEDVLEEAGEKAHQFTGSVQKEVGGLQHRAQDMLKGKKK